MEQASEVTGAASWAAIVPFGNDQPVARAWHGNPVIDTIPPCSSAWSALPIICWSGTLAASLFEGDPRNWMAAGREAFDGLASRLARADHAGGILLRPHARHLMSDIPSCVWLLREKSDTIGLAFAPMSLLEAPMLDDIADHLARSFEVLGAMATTVFLHDVAPPTDPDEPLTPRPLGRGVVPHDLLRGLIREYVRPGTPIVLPDTEAERQVEWLGLS